MSVVIFSPFAQQLLKQSTCTVLQINIAGVHGRTSNQYRLVWVYCKCKEYTCTYVESYSRHVLLYSSKRTSNTLL